MQEKKILVTQSSMPTLEEYIEEIAPLWESHKLTNMGALHNRLQSELEVYLEANNVELLSNGHMALEMSLQALKLKGEVITTPFTFASTTHAIVRNGLTPIFCDIDPETYCLDTRKLEACITDKTVAILPVHVYGNICDVEKIDEIAKKYNLKVIYDAAHAFGVKYKGKGISIWGDASCFSFHATKVFHTIEGGAVAFKDDELKKNIYGLKNFGIRDEIVVDAVGANAKMNEFEAAMGLCNLRHLDSEIKRREAVVKLYVENLQNIDGIQLKKEQLDVESNFAYFPIVVDEEKYGTNRDALAEKLQEENIFARKYFYPLTCDFECYKEQYSSCEVPIARNISRSVLTLPLYADIEADVVKNICEIIKKNGYKCKRDKK